MGKKVKKIMYKPEPIDTREIVLPKELLELTETIAKNVLLAMIIII